MAGRIRDEDIAQVRERARIDEVISGYVTLRKAGGGSLKGLCPFHDEKTPSFHVTPARQFWHCFGCNEGGDVITFLMKVDGLTFIESVERLADKYGVALRREDDGTPEQARPRGPARARLIEAHRIAAEFYAGQLSGPDAVLARRFLHDRQFDQAAAEHFGLGFAPRDGDALLTHLRQHGFRDEESIAAGLVAQGRSAYDRFRGRLLWPIRESSGDVIGFGARRLFDDDRIEAKYLNTPETAIYKKSQVLYGLDLARREIARSSEAVVVEGYTDVMAAHLSGVQTAVATCGTAFGDEHARVLRRFLLDHEEFRGAVVFTFDGDSAGQAAALKAFGLDQSFVSQTYVAVAEQGMDPCDLRIAQGDAAVRELIARRVPLYRFVLGNTVGRYDLDRADGRVDALREAARLVSSIRDRSKVDEFTRELAGMIGIDVEQARAEVRRAQRKPNSQHQGSGPGPNRSANKSGPQSPPSASENATPARPTMPNPRDPQFAIERETLKLIIQFPAHVAHAVGLGANDFSHPLYRALWEAIEAHGGVQAGAADAGWAAGMRASTTDPAVVAAISELGVEPVRSELPPSRGYVDQHVYRLQELTVLRRIHQVKSRLQRTNPEQSEDYNRMFGELVALEKHRRTLRDLVINAGG